jgi:antibiotic biosynthesis monooxygenase (ABM) superfamily enzyme
MKSATAITVFHPAGDAGGFGSWAQDLLTSAESAAGHLAGRVSVRDDPALDWAVALMFSDEDRLHSWLDSPQRTAILREGQQQGYWRSSDDVILTDDSPTPPGIGLFRHDVAAGKEADFRAMQARLSAAAVELPGYEGTVLLPADQRGEWLSMVRFRTAFQLSEWMRSAERTDAMAGLRSTLSKDFSTVSNITPFGTAVRVENGRTLMTPNWKTAMLVLLVLYPTVMLLSRFFGPIMDRIGTEPWLGMWVGQILSVSALQWWLMPGVSRPFRRWLDPVDGAGLRITLVGAAAVVVLYALTMLIFATVPELQFWDYKD